MTHSTNSLRELRQRRERADDWIVYASWTAIGIATLGCLIAVMGLLDTDEIEPLGAIVLISSYVSQGLFGWKLRERSIWVAWVLMTAFGISVVANAALNGVMSGIVWNVLIGGMYVRGFLATGAYHQLTREIAEVERQRAEGSSGSVPAVAT